MKHAAAKGIVDAGSDCGFVARLVSRVLVLMQPHGGAVLARLVRLDVQSTSRLISRSRLYVPVARCLQIPPAGPKNDGMIGQCGDAHRVRRHRQAID